MTLEFNEKISIKENLEDREWVGRQIRYLFQRGINFASHYGNGNGIEILEIGVNREEGFSSLHLRITDTKLEPEKVTYIGNFAGDAKFDEEMKKGFKDANSSST